MTKNEQHCIKQNEKSFTQNDLSLTELWQKGELPEGWYYLKVDEEIANYPVIAECVIDYALGHTDSYFFDYDEGNLEQVLAPVPSYDEWQESEKYINSLEEKIKIYERKEKQHTNDSIAYNELSKENEKLKEAVELIEKGLQEIIEGYRMTPISRAELLLKELNEVLK